MQDDTLSLELEPFDDIAEEDNDAATLIHSHSTSLTSTQYVVYSATFQVPAFYFTIHDSRACSCTTNRAYSEDQFQMDHRSR